MISWFRLLIILALEFAITKAGLHKRFLATYRIINSQIYKPDGICDSNILYYLQIYKLPTNRRVSNYKIQNKIRICNSLLNDLQMSTDL